MNREICGQCGQSLDPNWIDERLPKLEAMLHETTRERDSLRQHLHDEHQRHVGTMEERDALQADLAAARARVEKLEGAEEDRDEYQRQAKLYAERCAESDMELAAARALLPRLRQYIERYSEDHGYGYARPENPHDFSPDQEVCTANEMAAHKAACEAFDRGEYDDSKTPRSETVRDDGGKMVGHILRAPWGIGSYTFRDPHAIKLLAAIDAALAGERREGEE